MPPCNPSQVGDCTDNIFILDLSDFSVTSYENILQYRQLLCPMFQSYSQCRATVRVKENCELRGPVHQLMRFLDHLSCDSELNEFLDMQRECVDRVLIDIDFRECITFSGVDEANLHEYVRYIVTGATSSICDFISAMSIFYQCVRRSLDNVCDASAKELMRYSDLKLRNFVAQNNCPDLFSGALKCDTHYTRPCLGYLSHMSRPPLGNSIFSMDSVDELRNYSSDVCSHLADHKKCIRQAENVHNCIAEDPLDVLITMTENMVCDVELLVYIEHNRDCFHKIQPKELFQICPHELSNPEVSSRLFIDLFQNPRSFDICSRYVRSLTQFVQCVRQPIIDRCGSDILPVLNHLSGIVNGLSRRHECRMTATLRPSDIDLSGASNETDSSNLTNSSKSSRLIHSNRLTGLINNELLEGNYSWCQVIAGANDSGDLLRDDLSKAIRRLHTFILHDITADPWISYVDLVRDLKPEYEKAGCAFCAVPPKYTILQIVKKLEESIGDFKPTFPSFSFAGRRFYPAAALGGLVLTNDSLIAEVQAFLQTYRLPNTEPGRRWEESFMDSLQQIRDFIPDLSISGTCKSRITQSRIPAQHFRKMAEYFWREGTVAEITVNKLPNDTTIAEFERLVRIVIEAYGKLDSSLGVEGVQTMLPHFLDHLQRVYANEQNNTILINTLTQWLDLNEFQEVKCDVGLKADEIGQLYLEKFRFRIGLKNPEGTVAGLRAAYEELLLLSHSNAFKPLNITVFLNPFENDIDPCLRGQL